MGRRIMGPYHNALRRFALCHRKLDLNPLIRAPGQPFGRSGARVPTMPSRATTEDRLIRKIRRNTEVPRRCMEKEQHIRPAELGYRLPHVHRPFTDQEVGQMVLPVGFPRLASLRAHNSNQMRRSGDLLGPLIHRHTPARLEGTLIPDFPASLGGLQRRRRCRAPAPARTCMLTEQSVGAPAGDLPSSSSRPKIQERLLIASGIGGLHVQSPSTKVLLLSNVTSIDTSSSWTTSNKNPLRRRNRGVGQDTHLPLRHHRLPVPHLPRSWACIWGLDVPSRAKSGPHTGMHEQRGRMQQPKRHPTGCQVGRHHPMAAGAEKNKPRGAFGHVFTDVLVCQILTLRFAPDRPVVDELLHQQVVAIDDRSSACAAQNCCHFVGKKGQPRHPTGVDHIFILQRQPVQGIWPFQLQTVPINPPLGRVHVGRHARRGRSTSVTI
mmetsp:Transcript_74325/g.198291  ORF Transcript_74325/g.198291 Transcript_74325/m.198291 type:complete len:436 (-) Transcript_74325:322-1629(-)